MQVLQADNVDRWQFHLKLAVCCLRAIPLDMLDPWNRIVDELDELDQMEMSDEDMTVVDNVQTLSRLRPDALAVSWSKRQVFLLELTRAHDWRQDWARTTDTYKVQRYARLQTQMQDLPGLPPRGWVVERGSFRRGWAQMEPFRKRALVS
jgi:hypothetical protein